MNYRLMCGSHPSAGVVLNKAGIHKLCTHPHENELGASGISHLRQTFESHTLPKKAGACYTGLERI